MTIQELQAEQARLKAGIADAEGLIGEFRHRLHEVTTELAKRTNPLNEPRITDHALLRYMERVHGLDVESVRAEILTEKVKQALMLGATGYKVNGVEFICKDGALITVINNSNNNNKKRGIQ